MLTEEGRTETEIKRLFRNLPTKRRKIPISSRTSKIQGSLAREGEKENTAITQRIKTAEALLRELYAQKCQIDI